MDAPNDAAGLLVGAAASFRRYFTGLRQAFLEREALLVQLELALLAREHLLIIGPPGTGKSALASLALERIVDAQTGRPSLFSKQLTESTVQTDLIGPVDFKVLTETGRTEYLTDDGMLGATHAFLDEVFDGRDMLLRSILNVLHERELKHGRRVTPGRIECAVLTSNRYLSEVLARSPELLVAFADRLAFVSFVPKTFALPQSRAAMLERAQRGQRPVLASRLLIQELDLLQRQVEAVEVPSEVAEALELLADRLEQRLFAGTVGGKGHVPTKIFSQRSLVKAQWVLKAAVVRDRIWRDPLRPLQAHLDDLEALRSYFTLGGPGPEALQAMLSAVVDPRERAQLEIVRLESEAFTAALAEARGELVRTVEREAESLGAQALQSSVEGLHASAGLQTLQPILAALAQRLIPGPRHPANRRWILATARTALVHLQLVLERGPEDDTQSGASGLRAIRDGLELVEHLPELASNRPHLVAATRRFVSQVEGRLAARLESGALEPELGMEPVARLAAAAGAELRSLAAISGRVSSLDGAAGAFADQREIRARVAAALRHCTITVFHGKLGREATIEARASSLRRLEPLLAEIDPAFANLRDELLEPLARAHAVRTLGGATFSRIGELAMLVQRMLQAFQREGLDPSGMVAEVAPVLTGHLLSHASALTMPEDVEEGLPRDVFSGELHALYRAHLTGGAIDGETAALETLEGLLREATGGAAPEIVSQEVRDAIARVELAWIRQRAHYLRHWCLLLLADLPDPDHLEAPAEAARILDRLVRSRFPLLVLREGELLRLTAGATYFAERPGAQHEGARALQGVLQGLESRFGDYGRRLLELRGVG